MLHSQTTLILAAVLFITLPLLVGLLLQSTAKPSVAWWCAGGVLAGTGLVFMGLRPWLPLGVTFHLANTCLLGSFVLWSQSLRSQMDRSWPWHWVALWLLLCAAFYSVLMAYFSPSDRGFYMRLALGCLSLYTAYQAWRLSRQVRSRNAAIIAVNYVVLGLMLVVQGLLTARSISVPSPFSNTWDASLLALTALLTALIAHVGYVGMVLDMAANERITAQLAAQGARQTRLLDLALQRSDRRGRMGILSGSLAHELNQPLTAALMSAQLAQRRWAADARPDAAFLKLLDQVDAGVGRTVSILQRIREGVQHDVQCLQTLDLQQVLDQSLALMAPDMEHAGVCLTQQREPGPVLCQGDDVALSQVLVNVLRNAVQAMAQQRERRLWVTLQAFQGQAMVRVRDSGPGLAKSWSCAWSQPLPSTKPDGLGMGLMISWDIMQRHHGDLQLHNHPLGGAEAVLSLPLVQESA